MRPYSILFVCMGNICRSPTAEGVFKEKLKNTPLVNSVIVDSAGTTSYHSGEPPDKRATAAAARRGVDLSVQRSRQVQIEDFKKFDLILAMDQSNISWLRKNMIAGSVADIKLFLTFGKDLLESEVPDPYYGGRNGFEHVLDLIENASEGLIEYIQKRLENLE